MTSLKGLEWTFNTNSLGYEKFRPGYPDALYEDIFSYIDINKSSEVIEIGIGGGQASLPFLKTGCRLTAVEYGENFAKICREKFRDSSNFSVIVGKFEDVVIPKNSYDFIYSASAFHWIRQEVGYKKVHDILKPGGVFARFALHPYPYKANSPLSTAIEEIYAKYYYTYYNKEPQVIKEYTSDDAKNTANIAKKYGFCDICYKMYRRTRDFTAKEYTMLLDTYSDHIAMEKSIKMEFYSKIEEAIQDYGGKITIYDTIDLELAKKEENIL